MRCSYACDLNQALNLAISVLNLLPLLSQVRQLPFLVNFLLLKRKVIAYP